MAFRSAEIAADAIARALGGLGGDSGLGGSGSPHGSAIAGESLEASVARAYARRWRREFALRVRICRAIGRAASRPAVQTAAIAALRAAPAAGRLLVRGTRAGAGLTRRASGAA